METKEIFSQSTIDAENKLLFLPNIQLDRKEYLSVKKQLETIGGKWNTTKKAFVFSSDPTPLIQSLLNDTHTDMKKDFQFFATPDNIADLLIGYIEPINDHDRILEPSAGQGALIKAIHRVNPNTTVDCFELMDANRIFLQQLPNINIVGDDFLQATPSHLYDKIIMNPPFSKNQDITHVQHAYSFLKPNGTLVAIMSTHWTFATDKKSMEFSKWLYGMDEKFEILHELNQGEFKKSGTNISTIIIKIDK